MLELVAINFMRLQGTGTLNVQWDSNNETASAPAIVGGHLHTLSSIFLLHIFSHLYIITQLQEQIL